MTWDRQCGNTNIQIKSSAGHFFHSLLGCSWLHQIGNKSPASLYTSSEKTVNEMWEISLCVRACVRLSLCVRAQRLSLTFQVFLGSSVVLENAERVLFVCARHTGTKFEREFSRCAFLLSNTSVESENVTVVLTWMSTLSWHSSRSALTHTNNVLPASFAATLLSTVFAVYRAGRKAFGLA